MAERLPKILSSVNTMRKLTQGMRINTFKTLRINQRLAAMQ
jgi:hypothetical protein